MSWLKSLKKPLKHSLSDTNLQIGVGRPTVAKLDRGVGSKATTDGNVSDDETAQLWESEGRYHGATTYEGTSTSVDNTNNPAQQSRVLKSVLGAISAIYAHYEETALVADKVEDLISRIIGLEELFGTSPADVVEQRRRGELIRMLHFIEREFRLLYRKSLPQRLQENGDVSELLECLRKAISDYWMARRMELYSQEHKITNRDEAAVLNGFRCSRGAEFRHGARRGCVRGTRRAILDEIELWTRNSSGPPIYWLNGLARTGKTAIAQTIAERTFADGQLGASFFCSRDFEDRSNLRFVFPTIAVQLALKYPDFRSRFIPLVRLCPGISRESLDIQMQRLIVQPLQKSCLSTVIVIDALDECQDDKPTSMILSVLGQFVSEIPKVKFLITSRPEPHIRQGFLLPSLAEATDVFVLHKIGRNQVDNDIRLFFRRRFLDVARRRRDLDWLPTEGQLSELRARAAGSFVFAVAAVKFIYMRSCDPGEQLGILLQPLGSTVGKIKTTPSESGTSDPFYALVLQEAFGDCQDPVNDLNIRSVFGAMVLAATHPSPSTIAVLLRFDVDDVFRLLSTIRPLLNLQDDVNSPVLFCYSSFPDFIVNPDRCTNKRFHVSPPDHHPQLLMRCLDLMDRTLKGNMCQLPDGVANSDIDDLEQRIEQYLDPALQYACGSWHTHLIDRHTTSVDTSKITSAIHRFLESKFFFWLEILSVVGAVRNAVDALRAVADWLEESSTLDLVNDCFRFVTRSFETISASAPHIYHSALPLTPKSSIVWELYQAHARPFMRVVCGVPASWDSAASIMRSPFRVELAAWSPCSGYFAISPHDSVRAVILDSKALRRLQNLEFPQKIPSDPHALVFSPDSRTLTCSSSHHYELFVVTWDRQTGCVVSAIQRQGPKDTLIERPLITYSTNGNIVGVLYRYLTSAVISIHDVVSGVYLHDVPHGVQMDTSLPSDLHFYSMWTHGESLRFATAEATTITVREVGFTTNRTPTQIETLSVPAKVRHTEIFKRIFPDTTSRAQFLPASHRLALIHLAWPASQILVWDSQGSEPLFLRTDSRFQSPITVSSDGRFLACSTTGPEVYLWKQTSAGYALTAKLPSSTQTPSSLLSPNGEAIVVYDSSTIQLWHTYGFTTATTSTTSSSVSTGSQQTGNFILDLHPIRPLAAVARRKDSRVTILDLKSGLPQLTIDTGVEVHGLGLPTGNAIIVVGDGEVITWNLPEGKCPPDASMGTQDRADTVHLSDKWQNEVIAATVSPDLRHVALVTRRIIREGLRLYVYSAFTGQRAGYAITEGNTPRFGPGGSDIWCGAGNEAEVWTVTQDDLDYGVPVDDDGGWKNPWGSSRGYKATEDGWILGPDGKRLLMLPPPWQSDAVGRVWKGKYLALLHDTLPEPIILDLEP